MQVQLTTNKQNSNPAFGKIYEFSGRTNISDELYKVLMEKGAKPTRDFIGGFLNDKTILHLATGKDSFAPPLFMPNTNGLFMLGDRVVEAGKKVVKIVLDKEQRIAEQLNISLKTIGKDGKQEIDIVKK